jgi:hypothetical protein
MPNHMALPAIGAPYSAWIWNVSHKNAPGAIRAIALMVSPVKPSVARLDVGAEAAGSVVSAMMEGSLLLGRTLRTTCFGTIA